MGPFLMGWFTREKWTPNHGGPFLTGVQFSWYTWIRCKEIISHTKKHTYLSYFSGPIKLTSFYLARSSLMKPERTSPKKNRHLFPSFFGGALRWFTFHTYVSFISILQQVWFLWCQMLVLPTMQQARAQDHHWMEQWWILTHRKMEMGKMKTNRLTSPLKSFLGIDFTCMKHFTLPNVR